jgi:hypothetical protein
MAHHEVSTTVDVAANILFDYLSDLQHLPDYLPRLTAIHPTAPTHANSAGIEARQPMQPVHHEVEVTAEVPEGETIHSEGWIDIIEENRSLRRGVPGQPDYHGELNVDFVADGTSQLTVGLDTPHPGTPAVDDEVRRAPAGIKTTLERRA